MKIEWTCTKCGDTLTSDTLEHHKMDWCKCNKSGVDAEEEYIRIAGSAKILSKIPKAIPYR